tara:strand:- start:3472 stop:3723 length:252 start_codon:yes stop_codon:yes gene_type:complete
MTKGEEVKCIIEYNLFDNQIKDMVGLYVKTNLDTGKHLVYFKEIEEWAELYDEQIELVNDNFVTTENQKLADRIQELKITCAS